MTVALRWPKLALLWSCNHLTFYARQAATHLSHDLCLRVICRYQFILIEALQGVSHIQFYDVGVHRMDRPLVVGFRHSDLSVTEQDAD